MEKNERIEKNEKIIEMLNAINENLTEDIIEKASPEELAEYFEMITKIRAKVKNLK